MDARQYIESVLDDNEKLAVEQFASSEVMFEAVKKIVIAGLYKNGVLRPGQVADPLRNAALLLASEPSLSNEHIGADVRALWQGLNALEAAFAEIIKFKPEKPGKKVVKNPAV